MTWGRRTTRSTRPLARMPSPRPVNVRGGQTRNVGQIMRTPAGRAVAVTVTALRLLVAESILAVPLAVDAQPAGEVRRVGYLSNGSATSPRPLVDELRQGLRELGWVENRNIVIEYRWAEGKSD